MTNINDTQFIDKTLLLKKLQRDLFRNPPLVSKMKNTEILNYYQEFDGHGNQTNLWFTLQILTDLNRFNRKFVEISENIIFDRCEPEVLSSYAQDFYAAWNSSSYEVIKYVGFNEVIEVFKLLRRYPGISWDYDVLNYLEENNYPQTFTVFRGECKPLAKSGMCSGLSWTLAREVAEYYAGRLPDGVLHEGTVSFSDIFLFQSEEHEVVVNPGSVNIVKSTDFT